jgi:hypothetical protein
LARVTDVVYSGAYLRKRVSGRALRPAADGTIRLSVTIPAADHAELKRTASSKRVSLGWVVRDAIREYLRSQLPLLRT